MAYSGRYKVKNEKLLVLFNKLKNLSRNFKVVEVTHVPREKNKEADNLARNSLKIKQDEVITSTFKYVEEESPSSEG